MIRTSKEGEYTLFYYNDKVVYKDILTSHEVEKILSVAHIFFIIGALDTTNKLFEESVSDVQKEIDNIVEDWFKRVSKNDSDGT